MSSWVSVQAKHKTLLSRGLPWTFLGDIQRCGVHMMHYRHLLSMMSTLSKSAKRSLAMLSLLEEMARIGRYALLHPLL